MNPVLWRPSETRVAQANLTAFMKQVEADWGVACGDYDELWDWSVRETEKFWATLWDFAGVIAETRGERVLADGDKMPGARFFPDARLNFAENLLRQGPDAPGDALVFRGEDKVERRLSHAELHDRVSRLAHGLADLGVGAGDRVAAYLPNMPETVIAMLAAAARGAVFSSCSPDFGVQGVLDRFGQIEPKVLIACDAYHYNGKVNDCLGKTAEVANALPTLEKTLIVPYVEAVPDAGAVPKAEVLGEFLDRYPGGAIDYRRVGFNDPLYILFSSGTTGKPKCIVHGVGGTLLQHLKEHRLQCDVKPGDRVFYFTTCGWMMWNWLVSALASEAAVLLYDGSPFYPDWRTLFRYAADEGMTFFGTSAKYIDALANAGAEPGREFDLAALRTMASTGSPLVAESFDYVYEHVKQDICLSSISGGTDIVGCFVDGNPIGPVRRGEIQKRCLAMAVEVFDDDGNPVRNQKGEQVCTRPFPSMPIYFWNDPDGERYRKAYFETYPGVWHHGDFAELTDSGGVIVYGRSDATLNPGGVRIGTAEIYRQVEKLPEVEESIVVGQAWGDDQRVVLFVRLKPGVELDEALETKIKREVRQGASPRHTPARVVQVPDIPRTRSGKIVELAVRDVVHGKSVKNKEALANPEALEHFRNRAELQA